MRPRVDPCATREALQPAPATRPPLPFRHVGEAVVRDQARSRDDTAAVGEFRRSVGARGGLLPCSEHGFMGVGRRHDGAT